MAKHHPNKEISSAIEYALGMGWRYEISSGHAHDRLFCPANIRGGCIKSVYSTPRNPQKHADDIIREVNNCDHVTIEEKNDE
ncbi:hypothetical protein [uncultured Rubinisphaera sp.]|uniref:hypothetical protein n=1 Tax=uncultured Rubinisphaera sp. TaxID=1678686 RepID=UPI0030DD5A29|tara:strand:+ start:747 stop:992 length:246 start_codon:yes stop_codon:yes gene_type:complete